MGFKFINLEIPDIILVRPDIFEDHRGKSIKLYIDEEFQKHGISTDFKEDYQSISVKNVLRGLHFQKEPYGEGKLIRVLDGEIFDVAIDVRYNSPTYGKYVTVRLSSEMNEMLWIPPGFAHGYLILEEGTRVFYKITARYMPDYARGIIWNDGDLGIPWPIDGEPILSKRDSEFQPFKMLKEPYRG